VFLLIVGHRVPPDRRWKQVVPPRESPPTGSPPPDLLQERRESRGLQPLQVPYRRRCRQATPDMAPAGLQEGVLPLRAHPDVRRLQRQGHGAQVVPDSKYILAGSNRLTTRLFSMNKTGVVKTKPFLFLGHRDTVVGVFLGVDKMTNTVCRAYTVMQDCYIFSWELSGGDGKFDETGGENSEPNSLGTPEIREVETESGNGVSVKNKKRSVWMEIWRTKGNRG
jgi:hypothetical protein